MSKLVTPKKLRELQRALYLRAKKEPNFRAYALYDKVCRQDVLEHAYALVKANGGASGPDRQTFEEIETQGCEALLEDLREELTTKRYRPGLVRRVYIPKLNGGERPLGIPNIRDRVVQMAAKMFLEPLFEADFDENSYGFRPKRNAHQALDAIQTALQEGKYWIIDADVTAYFDTIPHDKLMKAVSERVVDGAMLALLKSFLASPIVDEREGCRPKRNLRGTPQGGVISPLLANVYLNLLDRNFRKQVEHGSLSGTVIRYADDFVLLSPSKPDRSMSWLQRIMDRLGLRLHPEKTRMLDARKEQFTFLGHAHIWRRGKLYLDIGQKALGRIREELRRKTRCTWQSMKQLVFNLNTYIRGARTYFRRVLRRRLGSLNAYVEQRVARWWARKHTRRRPAWSFVQGDALWLQHGMEPWYRRPGLVSKTLKVAR